MELKSPVKVLLFLMNLVLFNFLILIFIFIFTISEIESVPGPTFQAITVFEKMQAIACINISLMNMPQEVYSNLIRASLKNRKFQIYLISMARKSYMDVTGILGF